jgi:hypothetical protein
MCALQTGPATEERQEKVTRLPKKKAGICRRHLWVQWQNDHPQLRSYRYTPPV